MANINVRIDDKMEIFLKKEAHALGISLSDLVREKLTGDIKKEPLNEVTLENRIELLEKQQKKLTFNMFFLTRFLFNFAAICAGDDDTATAAWNATKKEVSAKNKSEEGS